MAFFEEPIHEPFRRHISTIIHENQRSPKSTNSNEGIHETQRRPIHEFQRRKKKIFPPHEIMSQYEGLFFRHKKPDDSFLFIFILGCVKV